MLYLVQEKHLNLCFPFPRGGVSNQLSEKKKSLKDLLSSPFFFFPLPALPWKNLQKKNFTSSLVKSSLCLCFPEYNQQETEVFVEHSCFLLTLCSVIEGEMLFPVLSAFLHFWMEAGLMCSKTTTLYSILGHCWESLGKLK